MSSARMVVPAGALFIAGCVSPPLQSEDPAVIIDPTPASRAELRHVVAEALNSADVLLADDALTRTDRLAIQRSVTGSLDHKPATGRMLGAPEVFTLRTDGTRCWLVHARDEQRTELKHTRCAPR